MRGIFCHTHDVSHFVVLGILLGTASLLSVLRLARSRSGMRDLWLGLLAAFLLNGATLAVVELVQSIRTGVSYGLPLRMISADALLPLLYACANSDKEHTRTYHALYNLLIVVAFAGILHLVAQSLSNRGYIANVFCLAAMALFLAITAFLSSAGSRTRERRSVLLSISACAFATTVVSLFQILYATYGWPAHQTDLLYAGPVIIFLACIFSKVQLPKFLSRKLLPIGRANRSVLQIFQGIVIALCSLMIIHAHYLLGVACLITTVAACGALSLRADHESARRSDGAQLDDLVLEDIAESESCGRIATRRQFFAALNNSVRDSSFLDEPAALLLVQVDDLSDLQQSFGRLLVDHYLAEIAKSFTEEMNSGTRTLSRIEDGMFAFLLVGETTEQANLLATRLEQRMTVLHLERPNSLRGVMSITTGVADTSDGIGEAWDLLNAARECLRHSDEHRQKLEIDRKRTRFG